MSLPGNHRYAREVEIAVATVREAASVVRSMYERQTSKILTKLDGSPVTDADLAADRIIRDSLQHAFPNDALLTEESADSPDRIANDRCWIADPIDGTAQFVARTGEFDVMLALVEDHLPVVSVTSHPPTGRLTLAVSGSGAWLIDPPGRATPFRIDAPDRPPRLVTSRYYGSPEFASHLDSISRTLGAAIPPVMTVGFQPRAFDPTWRHYDAFVGFWRADGDSPVREWDLAACDLLVTEAGGCFSDLYGNPYLYNQPSPRPKRGLLVSATEELHGQLLRAIVPLLPVTPPAVPTTIS